MHLLAQRTTIYIPMHLYPKLQKKSHKSFKISMFKLYYKIDLILGKQHPDIRFRHL